MHVKIGDVLDDKYRIVRLIGEGGMGSVYEGENTRIARRVAIKILHASVAASSDSVQRFEREAQAAGRIGSEHIVEVLDLGELPGGDRYMVMEFLDGVALSERIRRLGRLAPQAAARIAVQLLEGLNAAHAAGIVHRDLKPDNVFLLARRGGQTDFVKVVDFGISKFGTLGGEFSMTQTGAVMGTPYYLSPEQAKGDRNVDHRSDLYAAGVILWESTVGRVPFDGETFNELLFKIVLEPIPRLLDELPGLDPMFIQIVERAMARNPAERFQSAAEMQASLMAWLDGQGSPVEMFETRASLASIDTSLTEARHSLTAIHRTNRNWANTNAQGVLGAKSRGALWKIAAAAFLLLGTGGYFYQQDRTHAEQEAHALALAEKEAVQRAEDHKRETELARSEAEHARASADRARAEQERSQAERMRAQAELAVTELARKAAEEERAEKEAAEELARRRAAAVAAARAARASVGAQPPAPKVSPPRVVTAGRKIRTEL